MLEINKIHLGDCLELMREIPDRSIDMILCDLPYGTTASKWDNIISFKELWVQYKRIIKNEAAIVLTASSSFTYKIISSNEDMYKYKWIWIKSRPSNFVNAKNRPMTKFEEVLVFSKGSIANGSIHKMKYYPQGLIEVNRKTKASPNKFGSVAGKRPSHQEHTIQKYTNYPNDILEFTSLGKYLHPNQKPLDLFEYLIKTYTNENELVLDNCIGSGTTAIAALNTNRNFIGIEKDPAYYQLACERVENHLKSMQTTPQN